MSADKNINRVQRVEKEVKQCLASLIINLHQRNWSGILTVSRIKMPADFKSARVFLTFLGDESEKKDILGTLQSENRFLQEEVARQLGLRYCPKMSFDWEPGYESALKVDKILHEIGTSNSLISQSLEKR
jgi:ribosome-binding factor A